MQFLAVVNFTAAIQGLFLSYLLMNHRQQTDASKMLALLLLSMSVVMLGSVLGLSGLYADVPHLIRIAEPFALLIGPFLFFYLHLLTQRTCPPYRYVHLLPFLVNVLLMLPFYVMSGQEKIAYAEQFMLNQQQPATLVLMQSLRIVHIGTYVLFSLKLLSTFRQLLEEKYASLDKSA